MKKQISSILFIALLSCLIVLCALSAFATEDAEMWLDEKAPLDDYAYSMAIIGDTQKVSYLKPDNMSKIYDYIIDNAEAKNIKFVMGLGDITDQNMESEWVNDMAQIKRMDGIVPYSLVRGNHETIQNFNKYVPYADYKNVIAGAYEEGSMVNTYHTFTVGDLQYMVMCLDFGAKDDIIAWANKVIDAHPYHNVIVTTHAYMYRDGALLDSANYDSPSAWGGEDYNDGDEMWDKLIKKHENIVLVLSGHIDSSYVVMRQDEGDNGNTVTQMLINPQKLDADYEEEGCVGMVAMFYFSEDGRTVQVEYYSTIREQYLFESNQYTFQLDVVDTPETKWGISMDGYAIRLKDYNGLRGLFSFDMNYNDKLENELGYTLVEFGAIAMPEDAYISNGYEATIDSDTFELTTKGYKAPIWREGKYVNKILDDKNGIIRYCLAVVDFKTKINENLYFSAYSVYKAPNGETVIAYADYEDYENRLINLYQTTLDMYVGGAVNSKNSDDAAVWSTLLTGVVTLTEGTDYTASDAFGDTFTMKEFSACGKTEVSSIKLTVVNDPKNDSWVLIYRGSGSIPGTAWDVKHQLASQRAADYAITNPVLTAANDAKIKTVVIDHGITGVGGTYAFAQLDLCTLVYPETFETMMASAFYHCPNIRTVYCAHGDGVMRDFEEGLADYSYMDSFAGTNLYINVSNIPSKLHLPANITTIDAKMLSGTYGRGNMKAIWCGNTAEPTEGTIDLTGADITSIGNLAFDDLTALDTLILPDSVSSLTKEMFTDSDTLYIKTVKQAAYQADIAAFCIENSINYFTLTGEPNVAPAQ